MTLLLFIIAVPYTWAYHLFPVRAHLVNVAWPLGVGPAPDRLFPIWARLVSVAEPLYVSPAPAAGRGNGSTPDHNPSMFCITLIVTHPASRNNHGIQLKTRTEHGKY